MVGDPVAHSLSPVLHGAGFAELGIDASYSRLQLPRGSFDEAVALLRSGALDGINVTMPHKENAFHACDVRNELAERSMAVNTIRATAGEIHGYNTDVEGARFAVELLDLPNDLPVLILGNGGAARAIIVALEGRDITVSGRSRERARRALETVAVDGAVVGWGESVPDAIVINATPVGMAGEHLPSTVLERAAGLVDAVYGSGTSPAIALVQQLGRPTADGLDMLVGQALGAFEIFTGQQAPAATMMQAARGAAP